jgi:hypothetical protein
MRLSELARQRSDETFWMLPPLYPPPPRPPLLELCCTHLRRADEASVVAAACALVAQVLLAADQQHRHLRPAYLAHLLHPLRHQRHVSIGRQQRALRAARTLTVTLSSESGVSMLNAIRITWACE